jgi:hypothetical protein
MGATKLEIAASQQAEGAKRSFDEAPSNKSIRDSLSKVIGGET